MTGSDSADNSADNLKLVSAQTQHRATLFHFFAYNLGILPSVSVSWLQ